MTVIAKYSKDDKISHRNKLVTDHLKNTGTYVPSSVLLKKKTVFVKIEYKKGYFLINGQRRGLVWNKLNQKIL